LNKIDIYIHGVQYEFVVDKGVNEVYDGHRLPLAITLFGNSYLLIPGDVRRYVRVYACARGAGRLMLFARVCSRSHNEGRH
jgi:hypothetical protein